MADMRAIDQRYFDLLKGAVFSADPEEALAESADLGREFLRREIPPEEVTEIHHKALVRLAAERPDLKLSEVVERLLAPLMEVSMAYSLSFRQQLASKYASMMSERLAQSSRLEALGTLAAGIAHDFNTILGIINGYAELIGDDPATDADGRESAGQIITASFRARDLIVRMLAFARQKEIDPVPIDVVALVKEALELLRISLGEDVALGFESEYAQVRMLAAPSQIHQIVMNLCGNAADAMTRAGRTDIHIKPAPPFAEAGAQARMRFHLVVKDNGCGMPPEVVQRVFDPFYTTKEPGKGSGLGLSVVYGIVSTLGGAIDIQSRVGAGTVFTLSLPLIEARQPGGAGAAPGAFI